MFLSNKIMQYFQGISRIPWITLLLLAIALPITGATESANSLLTWHRTEITSGEWWRMITGHLVHYDSHHLLWNGLAFFVLGGLVETSAHQTRATFARLLFVSSSALSLGLLVINPDLIRYCGLSGLLNTLFVIVCYELWLDTKTPWPWLFFLGAILKVIWEFTFGSIAFAHEAWPPAIEAHALGLGLGLLIIAFQAFRRGLYSLGYSPYI